MHPFLLLLLLFIICYLFLKHTFAYFFDYWKAVCPITTGEQFIDSYGFNSNFWWRWIDLSVLIGFCVLCFTVAYPLITSLFINNSSCDSLIQFRFFSLKFIRLQPAPAVVVKNKQKRSKTQKQKEKV